MSSLGRTFLFSSSVSAIQGTRSVLLSKYKNENFVNLKILNDKLESFLLYADHLLKTTETEEDFIEFSLAKQYRMKKGSEFYWLEMFFNYQNLLKALAIPTSFSMNQASTDTVFSKEFARYTKLKQKLSLLHHHVIQVKSLPKKLEKILKDLESKSYDRKTLERLRNHKEKS